MSHEAIVLLGWHLLPPTYRKDDMYRVGEILLHSKCMYTYTIEYLDICVIMKQIGKSLIK